MILLFKAALILALGIFLVPRKWKGYVTLVPVLLLVVSTAYWSLEVLAKSTILQIRFFPSFWSGDLVLTIDKVSAFFILIINLTCLTGILYGLGYLKPYLEKKGSLSFAL